MRRHELTDEQFELLEPYLPSAGPQGGHPWAEHRRILNGLFWKLHTGSQWRDIPERYGPWSTIYDRYRRWCQEGRFAAMLVALRATLDEREQLDWQQWRSIAPLSELAVLPQERAKKGAEKRTGRSRLRPFQRRLWHQAACVM